MEKQQKKDYIYNYHLMFNDSVSQDCVLFTMDSREIRFAKIYQEASDKVDKVLAERKLLAAQSRVRENKTNPIKYKGWLRKDPDLGQFSKGGYRQIESDCAGDQTTATATITKNNNKNIDNNINE